MGRGSSSIVPRQLAQVLGLSEISIEDGSAVYFLVNSDLVVYVGQTTCLAARLGSHVESGEYDFDRAFFIPCPESKLREIESAFITKLRPKYNLNRNGKLHDGCIVGTENSILFGHLLMASPSALPAVSAVDSGVASAASPDRKYLSPREVAIELGVKEDTLAGWRCRKSVPLPFFKIGALVRYCRTDIEAFIAEKTERPKDVT